MARLWGGETAASGETGLVRAVSVDSDSKPVAPGGGRSCALPPSSRVSERTRRHVAVLAVLISFVPVMAGGQSVPNSAIAGGGGVVAQGNLKLSFTMGEPVAGPASNGTTRVIGGFQATFLPPDDNGKCTIFCDGFE